MNINKLLKQAGYHIMASLNFISVAAINRVLEIVVIHPLLDPL